MLRERQRSNWFYDIECRLPLLFVCRCNRSISIVQVGSFLLNLLVLRIPVIQIFIGRKNLINSSQQYYWRNIAWKRCTHCIRKPDFRDPQGTNDVRPVTPVGLLESTPVIRTQNTVYSSRRRLQAPPVNVCKK